MLASGLFLTSRLPETRAFAHDVSVITIFIVRQDCQDKVLIRFLLPLQIDLPLGEFRDNVAHSNYKYGIEVTRWLQKAGSSCRDSSEDEPAVLANNTIFKNGYNGLRFTGTEGNGAISLDGLVAVDNARTYHTSAALYWGSVSEDTSFEVGVRNVSSRHPNLHCLSTTKR